MNTDTFPRTAPQAVTPQPPPNQSTDSRSAIDSVRSASASVKESAGEQVRHVASEIREGGEEAIQAAKIAGVDLVSRQKEKVAAKIDEYTSAVKAACDSLKGDEKNPLSAPAEKASKQLERAAQYLRSKEPQDLLDDLGELARRRPEFVYGALFVAGLATVRFLKASTRGRRNPGLNRALPASSLPPVVYQTPSDFQP